MKLLGTILLLVGLLAVPAICVWRVPWEGLSHGNQGGDASDTLVREFGDGSLWAPPAVHRWTMAEGPVREPVGQKVSISVRGLTWRLLAACVIAGVGSYLRRAGLRSERLFF